MVPRTCVAVCIFIIFVFLEVLGNPPKFRILAPQFICPKDENKSVDKPDNTIISIQTAAGADLNITWNVRWTPLTTPSQRLTIMLWRAVRALEAKLNSPQTVPFVYVIENDELLHGIDYVFTVNAIEPSGATGTPKSFHIDNSQGNQKLGMIEGRADLLSIILVGGQVVYADMEFVLEAEVTACLQTQDYFFKWTVKSIESELNVDVSHITGSRLEIPPNSLTAGLTYYANCEVYKHSNRVLLTQTGLHFEVLRRALEVYLNVDYLMVTMGQAFAFETYVINHDYSEYPILFNWDCTYDDGKACDLFSSSNNNTLVLPNGLPKGHYTVTVIASVQDKSATAKATVVTIEHTLPVLKIASLPRILNEGSTTSLVANASNVAPTCSLTWYFATEEYLASDLSANETCDGCEHGEALSDTLTIYSLQETFLNELTDFSNETEWRQVSADMPAASGRARFVANCGCSLTFECNTEGSVHADVAFRSNESPKAGEVMVSPESGTALETVFRISTLAVVDEDTPLRYSFYCKVGANDTVMLGSYLDNLAVESVLPYIDGGTEVWVEVCDALGACSAGDPTTVELSAGDGSTIDKLNEDARAHIRRCELLSLRRLAGVAIVTYTNAVQQEALSRFTTALLEALPSIFNANCKNTNCDQIQAFLNWLASVGVDTAGVAALAVS